MEVEPQVYARGVEEEEEETEVEETVPLIRKHKVKDGTLNDERNDVVPVVQQEIEKHEGGDDVAKPMVYFDDEERDKSSDSTVGAFTPHSGHNTDRTTVEEIVESMPIKDSVKEDPERAEINLDAVLREQTTHDLYCPNCNSCITGRVILRKRKRIVRVNSLDAKREKVADLSGPVNDNLAEQSADTEPEVFGCLQCLCIFVRTATGYELLSKMFQSRDGDTITSKDLQKENTVLTPKEDTVQAEDNKNTNCLAFLLEWRKGEANVNVPEGRVGSRDSQDPVDHTKQNKQKEITAFDESDIRAMQQAQHIVESEGKVETVSDLHVPEDGTGHENRQEISVHEKPELVYLQHPKHISVASETNVQPANSGNILENYGEDLRVAVAKTTERFEEVRDSGKVMQENSATTSKTYIDVPENKDGLLISLATKPLPVMSDERVSTMPIITHETRVEIISQVGDIAETNITSERTFVTDGWDILKAIVYGGLTESITSLGVTSSAAGGDASTLSIVALGLANLIGGLFIIAHNILELKHDTIRYTETIGQPQNFWRNTIIVIVSYMIFGLVAPITYGFSFRESDNKDYKLIAVAIASLFCILILALGKARVTDGSYIKKIIYYAALGVAVSGVSYVVGVYVKKLLDQLGWISGSQNMLYHSSLTLEATGRASENWVSWA